MRIRALSDIKEERDGTTGISKLAHGDRLSNAGQFRIKVCDGFVSVQPDYGTVQVDLGIISAHAESDSFRGRTADFQRPGDAILQHQALTASAEGILAGEHQADFLFADLSTVRPDVGGVTHEVTEAVFAFKTPTQVDLGTDTTLRLNTSHSALRIEEGAFIAQRALGTLSVDASAPVHDLSIEQGAFSLRPVVDQLSLDGASPNVLIAANMVVVENGVLVANPTERLLAAHSSPKQNHPVCQPSISATVIWLWTLKRP